MSLHRQVQRLTTTISERMDPGQPPYQSARLPKRVSRMKSVANRTNVGAGVASQGCGEKRGAGV